MLRRIPSLALVAALSGCTGAIADPEPGAPKPPPTRPHADASQPDPPPSAADSGMPAPQACSDDDLDPGPTPLRRLTRSQYLNTVHDLFGDVSGLDAALGPAHDPSAFGLIQADLDAVQLESYQSAAELIAQTLSADPKRLAALAPCAKDADQRACARAFVEKVGARAYRAPLLDTADIDQHLALYDLGKVSSHAHGIELMLRAILQSARFLYQVEVGTSESVAPLAVKLSGYELAARLSYTIWDSLPDQALTAAAESGELDDAAAVLDRLNAMLADPRGQRLLARFLEQWIHLGDLESTVKTNPGWTADLRSALTSQTRRFFDHVLDDEAGSLAALLTSPTVFANSALADYYGTQPGTELEALTLEPARASGILTSPALLSLLAKPDESSPIYRGRFVRESLLCQQLPAPPPNIPRPPEVSAGVSTRERLKQHEVDPACSGCHQLMDPIGFAFEHFDAVGRYRDEDGDAPVDARGELINAGDASGRIDGIAELGAKLASSDSVRDCLATQWFRFALARFERSADSCALAQLQASFRASDADLHSLPQALIASPAFMYRRPADAQGDP